jgi:hypothetical protein
MKLDNLDRVCIAQGGLKKCMPNIYLNIFGVKHFWENFA